MNIKACCNRQPAVSPLTDDKRESINETASTKTIVLHVSYPYSRTGLTLLLKILILVCSVSTLELQMFFNSIKAALSLQILALTLASVPSDYKLVPTVLSIGNEVALIATTIFSPR